MSTTLRGSSLGRDKKGTSPSTSLIKKPSKQLSSQSQSPSSSSSSSRDVKPVSNHLKTPKKTGLDFSIKRSSSPDLPQKTAINRRRSFDRPPPVSHVQKAFRNVPVTREVKAHRSTSFSHKQSASSIATTSSTRPASNRTYARTTSALNKEGRNDTNLSKPRSIIKKDPASSSVTPMTKRDVTKKAPTSMNSESSIDQLVLEDDLVNMDNFEVQSLPDMSEMPDINQELGDPTITFAVDQSLVDVHDNIVDMLVEKTIDIFVDNEITETLPEAQNVEEQILTAECSDTDSNTAQNVEQNNANMVELIEEKKEEAVSEQEIEKNLEETVVVKDENPGVVTPAARPEPVSVRKAQIFFGKKEKQDYNDVIEETATKLMAGSGRKNVSKVLALAGAFETVISLQETSNSKN